MSESQFGFEYNDIYDIIELLNTITTRLEYSFKSYQISENSIQYIQLSFSEVNIKLTRDLILDKNILHSVDTTDEISISKCIYIPVSVYPKALEIALSKQLDNNMNITNIYLNIHGKNIHFLDEIKAKARFLKPNHMNNISKFDSSLNFYLLKDKYLYVLAIK